jgi:hypothetical protein
MAVILYLRSSSLPSPSSFFQTSHTQPLLSLALPLSSLLPLRLLPLLGQQAPPSHLLPYFFTLIALAIVPFG